MTDQQSTSVETRAPAEVPWPLVIALAATLAYAAGFWTTSLRGVVGAIERTDSPFTTWLWESTLTIPVFAAAVLGALTLALRWFGPAPRRTRAWVAVTLLIVAAATLAGVVELIASSAYDYHLQAGHLVAMADECTGDCLVGQEHATLALHVKAVGVGTVLLLVSNLVLVLWVLALAGGPAIASTRRRRDPGVPRTHADDLALVVGVSLVGAALVHLAVVREHLEEWPAAAGFFVLLALAEVAGAVLARRRPGREVWWAIAAMTAATLALWVGSRTFGMPFGPEPGVPEAVGLADVAACVLEVATLVACVLLLRSRDERERAVLATHPGRLAVTALVAVTVLGLAGGLHLVGAPAGPHSEHAEAGQVR